jgi:hypothetical protein
MREAFDDAQIITAAFMGDRDTLGPGECLSTAGHLDRAAGRAGGEIGARFEAVGAEDVNLDGTRLRGTRVAVGESAGADALQGEADPVELADGLGERMPVSTGICDDVAVLTGLKRYLAVFQSVEQHHLPCRERRWHGQAAGRVEQDVPELIDRTGQRRQHDKGRRSSSSSPSHWAPALTAFGSAESSRSAARTASGRSRRPWNGQAIRGRNMVRFGAISG